MMIKIAKTDADFLKCWAVIKELRPHLEAENFLPMLREMTSEGYELAFIEENEQAVAAIGFRYLQFLFMDKHIYIDDLSTMPDARGKGFGGQLLDFVENIARKKGYSAVTLDSGHQRFTAHRLYLNKGYTINSHHFVKKLA